MRTTGSVRHCWPGTMPADSVHVRSDHRVRADVDVALVDQRGRREADHAALAERTEAPPSARVGADRTEVAGRFEPAVDHSDPPV